MEKELKLLLGSKGAAEIIKDYGLGQAILNPDAIAGLTDLQRKRLRSLGTVTRHLTAPPALGRSITCSRDVFDLYRYKFGTQSQEQFVVVTLNTRNAVTSESVVTTGAVNSVHVNPSQIIRGAVIASAPSIICIHNHPSGDPAPSVEDRSLTDRIANACTLMGIRLLDHIILTADSYHSFSDSSDL